MLGQKTKLAKSLFNAGILKTFGKIDQENICKIDGDAERLVTRLIELYGWNPDEARSRVEGFNARLSKEAENSEITPNAGVGS